MRIKIVKSGNGYLNGEIHTVTENNKWLLDNGQAIEIKPAAKKPAQAKQTAKK